MARARSRVLDRVMTRARVMTGARDIGLGLD